MIFSIRKRLFIMLLALIGTVWIGVTWQVYVDTQHEVEELFDANLAQNAKVLFALIGHEMAEYKEENIGKHSKLNLEKHFL